jgi:short-subunit dehydrogenase involved in D-alanine esterification of teichoic acids
MQLKGKFAGVTGGGSGIGLAITNALRAAGWDVLIVGRNETWLQAARGNDSHISALAADLAHNDDRRRLIDRLHTGRPLDILINSGRPAQFLVKRPRPFGQADSRTHLVTTLSTSLVRSTAEQLRIAIERSQLRR